MRSQETLAGWQLSSAFGKLGGGSRLALLLVVLGLLGAGLTATASASGPPTWLGTVTYTVNGTSPYLDGTVTTGETSLFKQVPGDIDVANISWNTVWTYTVLCELEDGELVHKQISDSETGSLLGATDAVGVPVDPIRVELHDDGSYQIFTPDVTENQTANFGGCDHGSSESGPKAIGFKDPFTAAGSYKPGDTHLIGTWSCDGACSNRDGVPSGWTGTASWDLECANCGSTIEIREQTNPAIDPGKFDLRLDGMVAKGGVSNGTTGPLATTAGSHRVTETGANGTDLGLYGQQVSCVDLDQDDAVIVSGPSSDVFVDVPDNHRVVCAFTNSTSTLTVNEISNPSNDPGRFNLSVDGTTVASAVGPTGSTGPVTVDPQVLHSVGEVPTPGSGTSLENYSSTIACNDVTSGIEGIPQTGTLLLGLSIAPGHNVACTITNTRLTATVNVGFALTSSGFGTITSSPPRINCSGGAGVINLPAVCEGLFELRSTVTLIASPAPGSSFNLWTSGPCAGKNTPTCSFPLDEDTKVDAEFIQTGHCAAKAPRGRAAVGYGGGWPLLDVLRYDVSATYCYDGHVGEWITKGAEQFGGVDSGYRTETLAALGFDIEYDSKSELKPIAAANRITFNGGTFNVSVHYGQLFANIAIGEILKPVSAAMDTKLLTWLQDNPSATIAEWNTAFTEIADEALADAERLIDDAVHDAFGALRAILPDGFVDQLETDLRQLVVSAANLARDKINLSATQTTIKAVAKIAHILGDKFADGLMKQFQKADKKTTKTEPVWVPRVTLTVSANGVVSSTENSDVLSPYVTLRQIS